jgi:hypothetical protein
MELDVLAGNVESKHARPTAGQETVMAAPRWGGAGKISVVVLVVLFAAAPFLMPRLAMGSAPVKRTLTGCVVDGRFFSVSVDRRTNKPVKAYPMRVEQGPDLAPYEGKKLSMSGSLLPGDRFILEKGGLVVVEETCDGDDRAVIQKEFIMSYRVAGYKAAQKKDFDEALRLVNQALDMDTNLCGTYIDRALIYNLKGDFAAGAADIKRVKEGACADPQDLNFLIMREIGATLEKAGKKSDAIELYRMGLDSCQSDLCRERMDESLQTATRQ